MGASAQQRGQSRPPTLTGIEQTKAARRPARTGETIEQCIVRTLEQYFADLDGERPHALHGMVMTAVERPLLKFALDKCAGNQSAAADLLGINRNTLRKKLVEHGLAK
jgi:Fis family transcriptional regulator